MNITKKKVVLCVVHGENEMIVRVQSSEGEGKLPPNTPTSSQKILMTIYGCMYVDSVYVSDCIRNVKCLSMCIPKLYTFILCVIHTLQAKIAAVEAWEHIVLPTGSVFQKQG